MQPHDGHAKRAQQACTRCRQQKMKCLGGPSPPCDRCRRSGAYCSFEPSKGEAARDPCNLSRNNDHHGFTFVTPNLINVGETVPPRISSTVPSTLQFSGANGPPATGERNPSNPSKRARLTPPEPEQNDDHEVQSCISSSSKPLPPYATVQDLEESYAHSHGAPAQTKRSTVHPQCEPNPDYLARAGIPVAEAEAMFMLFGQRIAPYIPPLFETDFSVLPAGSLFRLAAIHTIARYLPGSGPLRAQTGPILRELLQNVLFDTAPGSNTIVKETLLGLVILYAYSEAGARDGIAEPPPWRLDMLTVKSIMEGYAVITCVPNFETRAEEDPFWHLTWLWMYTMSHHCATLHGCVRTINSSESVYRARHYVDTKFESRQIKSLVGEADLCLLWEHVSPMPRCTSQKIEHALDEWLAKWKTFVEDTAEGRQLHFHYLFTRFALRRLVLGSNYGSDTTILRIAKLDAGSAMLRFISTVSPVVQDRLRYICDTAFIMLAFVGASILGDLKTATDIPKQGALTKESLLADVNGIAALLLSSGAKDDLRPAIYGRALSSVCEALSSGSRQAVNHSLKSPEHSTSDSFSSEGRIEEGKTKEKSIYSVETYTFLEPDMHLPISAYDMGDPPEQLQWMLDGGADNFMDIFNSFIGFDP